MSVTSGFFNSISGDRRYSAEQMSAIFNGLINDGVYASIGTAFTVNATTGNVITVGIGRAWFNGTWLLNDAVLPLTAEATEVLLSRIDAVVIEIDRTDGIRAGSIKMVKGTPSSTPQRPVMVNTIDIHQYPLAYITRTEGDTEIVQADITSMIGTSSCPYVTGIIQVQNIDNIVAQWQAQWNTWTTEQQTDFLTWYNGWQTQLTEWTTTQQTQLTEWTTTQQTEFTDWESEQQTGFTNWRTTQQNDFVTWFNGLQSLLDENAEAQLTASVQTIEANMLKRAHSTGEGITPVTGVDAARLGGQLPAHYAQQTDMTNVASTVQQHDTAIQQHTAAIVELNGKLTTTRQDLSNNANGFISFVFKVGNVKTLYIVNMPAMNANTEYDIGIIDSEYLHTPDITLIETVSYGLDAYTNGYKGIITINKVTRAVTFKCITVGGSAAGSYRCSMTYI